MTTKTTGRQILDGASLFDQIVSFTRERFGLSKVTAVRSVDQAVILAHYALLHPEEAVSPSTVVDVGVGEFVLRSPEYRVFASRSRAVCWTTCRTPAQAGVEATLAVPLQPNCPFSRLVRVHHCSRSQWYQLPLGVCAG